MAKVKIFLEEGETIQDAEDSLLKAIVHHNSGEVHSSHTFQDPAMANLANDMEKMHAKMYQEMMEEICQELDKDYSTNGN